MKYAVLISALAVATYAFAAEPMTLSSESITPGKPLSENQVFDGFGCKGKNLSPQLSWKGVPKEAKSLAITMYDPDAPTGSGWWHWVAFNIPVATESLPEGAGGSKMPKGTVESMTDYGKRGFGGACPPVGDKPHRYIITLWALNVDKLELKPDAPAAMVGFNLNQHKIATAVIEGKYGR